MNESLEKELRTEIARLNEEVQDLNAKLAEAMNPAGELKRRDKFEKEIITKNKKEHKEALESQRIVLTNQFRANLLKHTIAELYTMYIDD